MKKESDDRYKMMIYNYEQEVHFKNQGTGRWLSCWLHRMEVSWYSST